MKFQIEKLEERIAPSVGGLSPISYSGAGLQTPGHLVPQDHISGEGIGPQSAGKADGGGALVRVFNLNSPPQLGQIDGPI